MDPAQLQQVIAQAVQAAVAAAIAAPNNAMLNQHVQQLVQAQLAAAQPPPQVPFLINPAGAGNAAWDLTSGTGLKIYLAAIEAIEPPYDGEESLLNAFLRKIWLRAQAFGFTAVLMVTDAEAVGRNITKEYGCVTLAQVQAAAITDLRQNDRRTQAEEIIRQLIQESTTPKLIDRLDHRQDNYRVNVAAAGAPEDKRTSVIKYCSNRTYLEEICTMGEISY
jgi:hypothetical protein